jgi:phage gpG-like protein
MNKAPNFTSIALKIKKQRPRIVAIEAAKFSKNCFVKGGFTNEAFQQWPEGKSPLRGKKTLIGYRNTMNLMQSIRTLEENENRVRTGTDLEYSEIHNNGGTVTVTKKMKAYWWAKYYEFAGANRKTASAQARVNAKAEFCRNMALMKVGAKIRIPQRKYIGESRTLFKTLDDWFESVVNELK